jgi:hypothetical protein
MNKINQSIIDDLSTDQGQQVLSIYMPTHQMSTPATIKGDQIRLKNLLRDGIEKLRKAEPTLDEKTIYARLDKAINEEGVWVETSKSLAIFTDGSEVRIFHLPIECSEYVCINTRYDTAPLELLFSIDQQFYVFALAKHNPKLFRGDMYKLQPVAIDLPSSPEDALHIDEMFNGSNTIRAFSSGGGGNDTLSTHGQGDSNHAGQEERLMYFRMLEHLIMSSEDFDANIPMVIAATQSEASDFKNLSKIPYLLGAYIPGNHANTQLHELHMLAWDTVVKEVLDTKISEAVEHFEELKGIQKASSDPDEIMQAAKAGRVDTLLVGMLETSNDSVEDGANTNGLIIRFNHEYRTRIAELVSAIKAQGGKIIGVDTSALTTPMRIAAVYRY